MAYDRINWENAPSTNTPLNADNLNNMDAALSNLDSLIATANELITQLQQYVNIINARIDTISMRPEGATGLVNVIDGTGTGSARTSGAIDNVDYPLGDYAFAEGENTAATGRSSHVEGHMNEASGNVSHSEGHSTVASGYASHAEGGNTIASGGDAHAEGNWTTASGASSHAEGTSTTASGGNAHAEGFYTTASGLRSHAEGSHTIAAGADQHVFGKYNESYGSNSNTYIEIVGNGTQSVPSNARTLDWEGNEVLAGKLTVGTAPTNNMDVATKQYVDNHSGSPAWSGITGKPAITSGTGENSILESSATESSADDTHAEGYHTSATADGAHAEGSTTVASGYDAHAEGCRTTASNQFAHAEGFRTTASGQNSHSEGFNTEASGGSSHAEGQQTVASADFSHAQNCGTIANHKSQTAIGEFNLADPSSAAIGQRGNYIEIVGNGFNEYNRSNARTLDWNGNEVLAGDLTVFSGSNNETALSDLLRDREKVLISQILNFFELDYKYIGSNIRVMATGNRSRPIYRVGIDGDYAPHSMFPMIALFKPFPDPATANALKVYMVTSFPGDSTNRKLLRMWSTDSDYDSELVYDTAPDKREVVYDSTTGVMYYHWSKTDVFGNTPCLTYRFALSYTDVNGEERILYSRQYRAERNESNDFDVTEQGYSCESDIPYVCAIQMGIDTAIGNNGTSVLPNFDSDNYYIYVDFNKAISNYFYCKAYVAGSGNLIQVDKHIMVHQPEAGETLYNSSEEYLVGTVGNEISVLKQDLADLRAYIDEYLPITASGSQF